MEPITWWLTLGGVFVLGIQTSISPCPLATNIIAISYIGKHLGNPKSILFSGLLYTAGRTVTYVTLAILLLVFALCTDDQLTRFFQRTIHDWLGPILIIIGMFLLGMISVSFGNVNVEAMQKWTQRFGLWSAFPIGILFALAFCPTSVATFLAMIGLSVQAESTFLFPAIYGVSTTFPVLIFAIILSLQTRWLGKAFNIVRTIDKWSRTVTGGLFIAIGIWFALRYNFEIF